MIDESLTAEVEKLVKAYLAGEHGRGLVYLDIESGMVYFQRWEDCVLDDTLYRAFGRGRRIDSMDATALALIVDECTVQVSGGAYDNCWYCDQELLKGRLAECDKERGEDTSDE